MARMNCIILEEEIYDWENAVSGILEEGVFAAHSRIRDLLLSVAHEGMTAVTELLLYNASRSQHIRETILPAISRGAIVITDRFTDSAIRQRPIAGEIFVTNRSYEHCGETALRSGEVDRYEPHRLE